MRETRPGSGTHLYDCGHASSLNVPEQVESSRAPFERRATGPAERVRSAALTAAVGTLPPPRFHFRRATVCLNIIGNQPAYASH